ncbi:zinc finger CCHC domain-containing protein 8-like isoform X2 [Limulus polyphemus]|uniref:Zinc finger CCHC domain-containing protein 8-like isoform X2 n=1 Tax=Limulus polyphemus TaxID=6850 RepID=A0ABM1BAI5_LIMPO|nr:zinc finger CCHC domain-containing protein 8-like isoform X2 [Limulus polyphemus]
MADFSKDISNDDELFIVFESNSSRTKNESSSKMLPKRHRRRKRRKDSDERFRNNHIKSNVIVTSKPNISKLETWFSTSSRPNCNTSKLGTLFSASRPNDIDKCIVNNDTIDGNNDNSGNGTFEESNENNFSCDEHLLVVDSIESSESNDDKFEINVNNLQNTVATSTSNTCKSIKISYPLDHKSESCTGSGTVTSSSNSTKHKISEKDQPDFVSSMIDEEIIKVTTIPGDDLLTTEKLSQVKVYKSDPNKTKKENLKSTPEVLQFRNVKEDMLKGPLINVTFKNKTLAEKYRLRVEQFLRELLSDEDLSINEDLHGQEDEDSGQLQFFQDFYVDTLQHTGDKTSYAEQNRLPVYDKNYREILQDKRTEGNPQKLKQKLSRPKFTCFNCMGDHLLDKCHEKHDKRRIAKNRKEYMTSSTMSKARYHQEERGRSFTPGVISVELQRALELQPNQLPPYIYRMRILGYPPGWLKEAEIESSGLMMYGSDGKAIRHDENIEDGVVDLDSMKVQYDPVKLVDYPGFNVPVPRGFIDESKYLRMPSLQFHQLRHAAKHTVKSTEPKPFVKRKFSESSKIRAKELKIDRKEEDMEVDYNNDGRIIDSDYEEANTCKFIPPLPPDDPRNTPPLPTDNPPNTPPLPSTLPLSECLGTDDQGTATSSQVSSRATSPCLTDLEETKKSLMQKLNQVSSKTDLEDTSSLNDEISFDDIKSPFATENRHSLQSDSEPGESEGFKQLPVKKKHSRSLSVSSGTPVLTKFSSFTSIPDSSKFKDGVSEHLPFENLSNSTGMYEKMRHVIMKVKQKLQQL